VVNIGARSLIRPDGERRSEWRGLWVTTGLFRAQGVVPAIGRPFDAADMPQTAAPAMMLGYERWQRDFDGDPAIIGRVLQFSDNKAGTVVGVLPRGLEFPVGRKPGAGTGAGFAVGVQDFWTLGQDRVDEYPGGITLARLRPGTPLAAAEQQVAAAAASGAPLLMVRVRAHALGLFAPALPLLQGFAVLVLLIA
jgi:hypothetical protein